MKDLKMLVAQGAGGGHFQLIDLGKAVSGLVADIVWRMDADLLGLGHCLFIGCHLKHWKSIICINKAWF